ncbi:hypothetical protein P7C70_g7800, partial [Phenoliferia sp. Uapishka_3]
MAFRESADTLFKVSLRTILFTHSSNLLIDTLQENAHMLFSQVIMDARRGRPFFNSTHGGMIYDANHQIQLLQPRLDGFENHFEDFIKYESKELACMASLRVVLEALKLLENRCQALIPRVRAFIETGNSFQPNSTIDLTPLRDHYRKILTLEMKIGSRRKVTEKALAEEKCFTTTDEEPFIDRLIATLQLD